jgi:hypothetical protein
MRERIILRTIIRGKIGRFRWGRSPKFMKEDSRGMNREDFRPKRMSKKGRKIDNEHSQL